jgi:hypothetical protein
MTTGGMHDNACDQIRFYSTLVSGARRNVPDRADDTPECPHLLLEFCLRLPALERQVFSRVAVPAPHPKAHVSSWTKAGKTPDRASVHWYKIHRTTETRPNRSFVKGNPAICHI